MVQDFLRTNTLFTPASSWDRSSSSLVSLILFWFPRRSNTGRVLYSLRNPMPYLSLYLLTWYSKLEFQGLRRGRSSVHQYQVLLYILTWSNPFAPSGGGGKIDRYIYIYLSSGFLSFGYHDQMVGGARLHGPRPPRHRLINQSKDIKQTKACNYTAGTLKTRTRGHEVYNKRYILGREGGATRGWLWSKLTRQWLTLAPLLSLH